MLNEGSGLQGYKHTFDQVEEELDTLDFLESLPENILDDADDETAEDLCRWVYGHDALHNCSLPLTLPSEIQQHIAGACAHVM